MEGDSPKWRIDTLDGRGGLAFASWRTSDLEDGTALSDRPTFYFSPPAFTPLPVASSATALAAERHGFQLGLFDADGEIPFDSIADVAEFVRRLYLGSGRSDGTDGGGTPPVPPPPTGEPPDIGPMTEEWRESQFNSDVSEFLSSIEKTPRGRAKPAHWHLGQNQPKVGKPSSSPIFRGAELTLIEMLARFPVSKREEEIETWEAAASRLAASLFRIGVMNFVDNEFSPTLLHFCRNFLQSLHFGEATDLSYPISSTFMVMIHGHTERWRHGYPFLLNGPTSSEPLDDLAHFPISKIHASAICAPNPDRASVADLLSAILASPGLKSKAPNIDAILQFAAARIVSFDGAPWTSGRSIFPDKSLARETARLTMKAGEWLDRELPRLNFSSSVEILIERPPSASTDDEKPQSLFA